MATPASTSVIIPACNEGPSIGTVVRTLTEVETWHEILVVDDGSNDETAANARGAGARVIRHPYTKGNGAAVKTGLRQATGDFILIIDGDGQHRAALAPRLVERLGEYDLVVGARPDSSQATVGRRLGNRLLARLATYLSGHQIDDLTSGFRAARRDYLLEFLHLLPNGFSTPATTTLAFVKAGYNVAFEPTETDARTGQSKIRLAPDGFKFFLILLRVITIFSPLRVFIPVSAAAWTAGAGYALYTIATELHVTNSSVLLIVLGVVIFCLGLLSEQISALRFERRDRE